MLRDLLDFGADLDARSDGRNIFDLVRDNVIFGLSLCGSSFLLGLLHFLSFLSSFGESGLLIRLSLSLDLNLRVGSLYDFELLGLRVDCIFDVLILELRVKVSNLSVLNDDCDRLA